MTPLPPEITAEIRDLTADVTGGVLRVAEFLAYVILGASFVSAFWVFRVATMREETWGITPGGDVHLVQPIAEDKAAELLRLPAAQRALNEAMSQ